MGVSCSHKLWKLLLSAKFLLRKQYLFSILLIFSIFVYYKTSLIVDWGDVDNWKFNKRHLHEKYYFLNHHEPLPGFECSPFLYDNEEIFRRYRDNGRLVVNNALDLPMDCDSLKSRILPKKQFTSVMNSYAISRVVYKDYYWLETVFAQTFSPNNSYCFALDKKSSSQFADSVEQLANCFPNVAIASKRYNYDSSGHFLNYGHFDCTEQLLKMGQWKYIIWLQNHDLVLRTNEEVSRIIEFLNGSHAIGHKPAQWKRYAVTNDWSAKSLNLWKNASSRTRRQRDAVLDISQNYNEVFLSREIVDFVVNQMNYKNLLGALEVPYRFATDELFWATLIATEDLELPGAPREKCPDNRYYITRYNEWEKWYNPPCKSGFSRHGTCIFGMEYLPMFSNLPQIAANKILPNFDYGFAKCFGELLFNRTFHGYTSPSSIKKIYSGDSRVFC